MTTQLEAQQTGRNMLKSIDDFLGYPKELKAESVGEIVDGLFGTDKTALVKGVSVIPAAMVESVTDMIIANLKAALIKKLTEAEGTG
jgi:hypothetical protein